MARRQDSTKAPATAAPTRPAAAVVERAHALVAQGYGLHAIAARAGLPPLETLRRWLVEDDDFRARYDAARDLRAEFLADDVVMLADAVAGPSAAGAKLRIDVRRWRVELMRKDAERDGGGETPRGVDDEIIRRLEEARERIDRMNAEQAESPARSFAYTGDADDGEASRTESDEPSARVEAEREGVERWKGDRLETSRESFAYTDNADDGVW